MFSQSLSPSVPGGYKRKTFSETLTPANQDVGPEVFPLREEGDGQQRVKVEAFHQQPEEAGHYTVLEEHHHNFAANLHVEGKSSILYMFRGRQY